MIRSLQLKALRLPRSSFPVATIHLSIPAITRAASLSAIHRGLRRSERAQYGEARPRPISRRGMENLNNDISRTQKALDGAGSTRQQNKLLKKLQKKESKRDGTGPKSRRKRFHDPESEHGKQSLVYHAQHGVLKDMAAKLDEPVRPRTQPTTPRGRRRLEREQVATQGGRVTSENFRQRMLDGQKSVASSAAAAPPRSRKFDDDMGVPRAKPMDTPRSVRSDREERGRGEKYHKHSGRNDKGARPDAVDGGPKNRKERRALFWGDAPARQQANEDEQRVSGFESSRRFGPERIRPSDSREEDGSLDISAPKPRERSKGNMMPLTIKYTTAASQFLYGRSVVRSALEQARRRLYKLYIYAGENRQEMGEINEITRLAKRHSVPITIVPQQDQRLMDKMSQGRPHNGFVLETSPIPQKPIKGLGELEETSAKNGFHVTLDRQTMEEQSVNGTDTFIRRASGLTAKPFVLLLDEILDPGNLGAMLRTASYLGVDAVGITNRNTSRLTPVVLKSAAGAVEEITIFSVDNASQFLHESRKAGWKSFAAVPPPSSKLSGLHKDKFISTAHLEEKSPLSKDPCILVLGNEGYGLSKQVKVASDYEVSVPRYVFGSCIDSLNVSVATGLLCHSFVRKAAAGTDVEVEESPSPESEAESSTKPVADVMF